MGIGGRWNIIEYEVHRRSLLPLARMVRGKDCGNRANSKTCSHQFHQVGSGSLGGQQSNQARKHTATRLVPKVP